MGSLIAGNRLLFIFDLLKELAAAVSFSREKTDKAKSISR